MTRKGKVVRVRPPEYPPDQLPDWIPPIRRSTVLFDEANEPFQMVSAAIFSSSYRTTEKQFEDLYERLCVSYYYLDGHSGYERFKRQGFHATDNPREIHTHLVDLLAGMHPIRILIIFTDGTRRPDLGPVATTAVLYRELIRTVFQACHGAQELELVFEQNDQLNDRFEKIFESSIRGLHLWLPTRIYIGAKKKPHALAVADYAMHAFGRWESAGRPTQPRDSQYSQWRAIRSSVAMVRSLEAGPVIRRGLAVM